MTDIDYEELLSSVFTNRDKLSREKSLEIIENVESLKYKIINFDFNIQIFDYLSVWDFLKNTIQFEKAFIRSRKANIFVELFKKFWLIYRNYPIKDEISSGNEELVKDFGFANEKNKTGDTDLDFEEFVKEIEFLDKRIVQYNLNEPPYFSLVRKFLAQPSSGMSLERDFDEDFYSESDYEDWEWMEDTW